MVMPAKNQVDIALALLSEDSVVGQAHMSERNNVVASITPKLTTHFLRCLDKISVHDSLFGNGMTQQFKPFFFAKPKYTYFTSIVQYSGAPLKIADY
jgi:hypothetical protein